MWLVYIINQRALDCRAREVTAEQERSSVQTRVPHRFLNLFFPILTRTKKTIKILMKILAKITIIVVENREPYYFIIICECKRVPLYLFSYHMLASTLTMDWQSIYYKVYNIAPQKKSQGVISGLLGGHARVVQQEITHCPDFSFRIFKTTFVPCGVTPFCWNYVFFHNTFLM